LKREETKAAKCRTAHYFVLKNANVCSWLVVVCF